jgi:hypothetical protein
VENWKSISEIGIYIYIYIIYYMYIYIYIYIYPIYRFLVYTHRQKFLLFKHIVSYVARHDVAMTSWRDG